MNERTEVMQFRDLKRQYEHLKKSIHSGIDEVLNQSNFIMGQQVVELERELASYVQVNHCITCANGTDALQLVLMAWGVGPGDAVFTSDFTFFASAEAASITGATPVFVDIDLDTYNLCPKSLESKIETVIKEGRLNPKAIVAVDIFGQPAQYELIELIAKKYDLKLLEDGAQAFGGSIKGKRVGAFGDAATTSFFPAKPLGCYGDGGAIFTNDDELAQLLRSLRSHGRSAEDKYDNRMIGMNSRLDTLQAAILIPKFKAFRDFELESVNQIAVRYSERLKDLVKTPIVLKGYESSWAQYTIRLNSSHERDVVQSYLKSRNIPCMVYYPKGLHQQTAYASLAPSDSDFPNTVLATKTVLSLPMHPYLQDDDVELVANSVIKALT